MLELLVSADCGTAEVRARGAPPVIVCGSSGIIEHKRDLALMGQNPSAAYLLNQAQSFQPFA
jgi:hypothetical protein